MLRPYMFRHDPNLRSLWGRLRRVVTVPAQIAPVLMHIPPIGAAIAPVVAQIALVLPDVARFLPRRGRITRPHILPALAPVLPNVAAIAACVTAILAQLAPVATHFVAISRGVAGLLGTGSGGDAKCQSQQRGDECPISHVCPSNGLRVLVETAAGLAC